MQEETILNWTRGNLRGEWRPSDDDINMLYNPAFGFEPVSKVYRLCFDYDTRARENSMRTDLMSFDAYRFSMLLRQKALFKLNSLPWDTNLMNAFHTLHFALFMEDMTPVFFANSAYTPDDGYTVPAWQVWILQMVFQTASECMRDDFIRLSKKDDNKYRISAWVDGLHSMAGMKLHVTGDAVFHLYVSFSPETKKNGTLSFKYSVYLESSTWDYAVLPTSGPRASKCPLLADMKKAKKLIHTKLARFSRELAEAPFNRPEYALQNINGGKL